MDTRVRTALGALAAGVLIGVAWGPLADRLGPVDGAEAEAEATPETARRRTSPPDDALERLRRDLDREIEARRALEAEVAALRDWLAGDAPPDALDPELAADAAEPAEEPGAIAERSGDPPAAFGPGTDGRSRFDEDALRAAGVHPADIERLREAWEEHELERLYLTDRARREGWARTSRYRQELRALGTGFRDDLGEDAYDALLYATGRPNRVVVGDVLDRSPAQAAGLAPGDVIVDYDGARVYAPSELQKATSLGRAGESVTMEVLRDGRSIRLRVDRGPLGVLLTEERRPPLGS